MSPSHQVRHTEGVSAKSTSPPASRLATPIVALTMVLSTAPRPTSARMSRTRSSEGRKPATRRSSQAPTSASRVLPIVMPRTV
jgi:hypothetical protein